MSDVNEISGFAAKFCFDFIKCFGFANLQTIHRLFPPRGTFFGGSFLPIDFFIDVCYNCVKDGHLPTEPFVLEDIMENCTPLISVIVPVYNVEKYLPDCIDSILAQTYQNLEIILIDDGSPDNCGKICDGYAEKDSRIKVIHKENGGVSSARNAGLDAASGEYVGFVDSDDIIAPTMYEELYGELLRTDSDVSICKMRRVRSDLDCTPASNENIKRIEMTREEAISEMIIIRAFSGSLCNKLFKAELVQDMRLDESIAAAEDLLFATQIILNAKKVIFFSKELYYYFVRQGSATRISFSEKHLVTYDVCLKIIELLQEAGVAESIKKYTDASVIVCNVALLRRLKRDKSLQKKYAATFRKNMMPYLNKASFSVLTRSIKINVIMLLFGTRLYYFLLKIFGKIK